MSYMKKTIRKINLMGDWHWGESTPLCHYCGLSVKVSKDAQKFLRVRDKLFCGAVCLLKFEARERNKNVTN